MDMEKMDKNSNIERLLQAVEAPEGFDDIELESVMNGDDTKEFYSLLSDIEAVKSIDNAVLPDVNAEWSNFARWMRKRRILRPARRLRRMQSWTWHISVAAVVLFVLFVTVPFMVNDSVKKAELTADVTEKTVNIGSADDSSNSHPYGWGNNEYLDYMITPARSYTLPDCFETFNRIIEDRKIVGFHEENMSYRFYNYTILEEFQQQMMEINSIRFSRFMLPPAGFVKWQGFYNGTLLDW